jgi:hypothetical protein
VGLQERVDDHLRSGRMAHALAVDAVEDSDGASLTRAPPGVEVAAIRRRPRGTPRSA